MSWLFSQALVEEYSAATCSGGEPSAPLSVMPTQHKFWRNDKTIEPSRLSLFGLTCAVLKESHGEALLTSFRADFPAKTYPLQGKASASRANAPGFGNKWRGSFAKYSPDTSSWKTAQCSLLGDSEEFSETWPRWGSMVNGAAYPRQTWAPITIGKESGSLLPTLTVNGNNKRPYPGKKSGWGLASKLSLMPTLTRAGLNGGSNSRAATKKRGEPPTHIGPLNPMWCEWFMGFPLGWTELTALEMDKFQEWQQQHSLRSVLTLKESGHD